MAFVPDEFAKTIAIPVRIVSGRIEFFYGGPLPSLEADVIGDLVVPAFAVTDPDMLRWLQVRHEVEILPKDAVIYLGMEPEASTIDRFAYRRDELRPKLSYESCRYSALVPVLLDEPLRLILRGTKRPVLGTCRCRMPALHLEAESINQMYSLISAQLEQKRRSHVANVFRVAYVLRNKSWLSLDDLRGGYEADIELYFAFASLWNTLVVTARATVPTQHERLRLVATLPRPGNDVDLLCALLAGMNNLRDIVRDWAGGLRREPDRPVQQALPLGANSDGPLTRPHGGSPGWETGAEGRVPELAEFRQHVAVRIDADHVAVWTDADQIELAKRTADLLRDVRTRYALSARLMDPAALHVLQTVNPLLRSLCDDMRASGRGKEEQ